jgi:hypothetical protein
VIVKTPRSRLTHPLSWVLVGSAVTRLPPDQFLYAVTTKSTKPLIVTFGAGAGAGAWAKTGGASIPRAAMKKSAAAAFLMYSLLMLSELPGNPYLTLTLATPTAAHCRGAVPLFYLSAGTPVNKTAWSTRVSPRRDPELPRSGLAERGPRVRVPTCSGGSRVVPASGRRDESQVVVRRVQPRSRETRSELALGLRVLAEMVQGESKF